MVPGAGLKRQERFRVAQLPHRGELQGSSELIERFDGGRYNKKSC